MERGCVGASVQFRRAGLSSSLDVGGRKGSERDPELQGKWACSGPKGEGVAGSS